MTEVGKLGIITNNAQMVAASMKVYDFSTMGEAEFKEDFDFIDTDNFEEKGFDYKWQDVNICTKDLAKITLNYKDLITKSGYYYYNTEDYVYYVSITMEIEIETE